jgi:transcriptional regulator with XRE-family HTH domain
MASHEKPADRGARRARAIRIELGRAVHDARVDRGLSLADVGSAVGLSAASISRAERGLSPNVSIAAVAQLLEVVGLEFSGRAFPGSGPIRDAAHIRLLEAFRTRLHRSVRWATEVPLPTLGDQRGWDAMISMPTWRYGVEAETSPRDAQALDRRIQLKARDSNVDGVILLLPDTRAARVFLDGAGAHLRATFPVPGRRVLELLGAGVDPGGSSTVMVRVPPKPRTDLRR